MADSINKIIEDDNTDWWRASPEDGYDLTRKLYRTGCRPIYRKYINCTRNSEDYVSKCYVNIIIIIIK